MIGWEFPPYNSGGLGIACQGLTRALAHEHVSQVFVLPKQLPVQTPYIEIVYPQITHLHVNMRLFPYGPITEADRKYLTKKGCCWSTSMVDEAYEYAEVVGSLAQSYRHDLIHAHDWMTYPAALSARKTSRKPVIMHVHSTEYDRTLNGYVNPTIAEIEAESLKEADKVITVSNYTKGVVCERYGLPDYKVEVVHNGIDVDDFQLAQISDDDIKAFASGKKVIIFVGRLTCQKGPDYFVRIADRIARQIPSSLFVIAGSGDMYEQIVMQSAGHRLTGRLLYAGFLRDKQKELLYKRADLFIMPSVSEPFGIVALEAAIAKTPVIISRQSGVREVLSRSLEADYWDVDKIATQAIWLLQNDDYRQRLAEDTAAEARNVTWGEAAHKCVNIYRSML
ncbi:MAG: glycosyltransferase family 4 protein [Patescibacteria group bacterium]